MKFEDLFKKAEQGDVHAQYELGLKYVHEHNCVKCDFNFYDYVTKNGYVSKPKDIYNLGIMWLQKAIEQGHTDAAYALAESYIYTDNVKAVMLLEKAAEMGSAKAENMLGEIFLKGISGVGQDVARGKDFFMRRAKNGDNYAARRLGEFFYYIEDYKNAVFWFSKEVKIVPDSSAAKKRLFTAETMLYTKEENSKFFEDTKAKDADAQYKIGYMLRYALYPFVVEKEDTLCTRRGKLYFGEIERCHSKEPLYLSFGVNCLKKAALQGHTLAQVELAEVYHKGISFKKDDKEALLWLEKAEEEATFDLLKRIEKLKSDIFLSEAISLLKNSAKLGNETAEEMLNYDQDDCD